MLNLCQALPDYFSTYTLTKKSSQCTAVVVVMKGTMSVTMVVMTIVILFILIMILVTDFDDEGDVEDIYDHHDHNENPNFDNGDEEGLAKFDDHDHHKLEYMRKSSPTTPWSRG